MTDQPPQASDMEMAISLGGHIENPCEVETYPGQYANLREFYLREAERLLPTFTDPNARKVLEDKIKQYRNP